MRWSVILFLVAEVAVGQYARPYANRPVQRDPLLEKIDSINAQVDALNAELAALDAKKEQDAASMLKELPNVRSLDELFAAAKKYPHYDCGAGLLKEFMAKFYELNRESLSSLDPKSEEFRTMQRQNEAKLTASRVQTSDVSDNCDRESKRILGRIEILLNHSGGLIALGNEQVKADQEAMAIDVQRQTAREIRELRQEVRDSNDRLINEVNQAEWRLRNW
jgi:hypothetical protein